MQGSLEWFYLLCLAVFGLIFGSFANVVIWRFPRGESLSSPGSHCPGCDHPIRARDNVPIVSWLMLRGRCRDCGEPISWRYPAVEGLSATLWVVAGVAFGATPRAAVAVAFFYLLMILSFIDLDTMRLPNALVALLAGLGLVAVLAAQWTGIPLAPLTLLPAEAVLAQPVYNALAGVAIGAGFLGLVSGLYALLRRRRGLGMGDIKLVAAAGLYVGPFIVLALLFGSFFGLVGGLALVGRGGEGPARHRKFPFGPFLAAGIVVAALAGPSILAWYASVLGR